MEPNQVLFSPENLKKARKKSGYSQEAAADQMGLSIDTIRAYEQGRTEPPISRLREMGRLYGVSFIV